MKILSIFELDKRKAKKPSSFFVKIKPINFGKISWDMVTIKEIRDHM
jgi:hypothetical protein